MRAKSKHNAPYTLAQLVQEFIIILEHTGIYVDNLKEYRSLDQNKQAWTKLKKIALG